jgi:hypothetical protein
MVLITYRLLSTYSILHSVVLTCPWGLKASHCSQILSNSAKLEYPECLAPCLNQMPSLQLYLLKTCQIIHSSDLYPFPPSSTLGAVCGVKTEYTTYTQAAPLRFLSYLSEAVHIMYHEGSWNSNTDLFYSGGLGFFNQTILLSAMLFLFLFLMALVSIC